MATLLAAFSGACFGGGAVILLLIVLAYAVGEANKGAK